MYQSPYDSFQMRSDFINDYFIPVEDSIVYEPEVYYPTQEPVPSDAREMNRYYGYEYRSRELPVPRESFTHEEARRIGTILGVDWSRSPFDVEQFRAGLNTELEHGRRDPQTNVTGDDPIMSGKIALAHLKEFPDYYDRLTKLEEEAKKYWAGRPVKY